MTTAEKIYELLKTMPDEQVSEVLDFAEFLCHRNTAKLIPDSHPIMPPETLTGLRSIAKRSGNSFTDEELREDYTNYLDQKYHVQY